MSLATIDLQGFTAGDNAQRQDFASSLKRELRKHGFVKIVGHGIAEEDIVKAFEWASRASPIVSVLLQLIRISELQNRRFFQLSFEQKSEIAHPGGSKPQRGWSAVGKENAASLYRKGYLRSVATDDRKDSREHFDQGSKTDPLYPNLWPDQNALPGFQEFMERWYEQLGDVATRLMEALEVAFELPLGSFLDKMTQSSNASEARLLHYPAIDVQEVRRGSVSRIWPHFDLGVLTLLFQDGIGGLECEDRRIPDTFIPVESGSRDEMVVNVSETLQRWTNDELPAGLHRVTLPQHYQGLESGMVPERYSITYFGKADREASVGPLPQFAKRSRSRYEDMTAIQYHQSRLQSAY